VRELLQTSGALLTRSDLAELGLPRGAVDSVFRALPTVHFEGYTRPMVRVEDYLRLVEERTFDGRTAVLPPSVGQAIIPGAQTSARRRSQQTTALRTRPQTCKEVNDRENQP
jgi:hypothetical protein